MTPLDDVPTSEGAACPSCGTPPPTGAAFCGECGLALADAGDTEATVMPEVVPEPAVTVPEPGPEPDVSVHRSPGGGVQSYGAPDGGAALGPFLDGDLELAVLETRGLWARVADGEREVGWVDGRALVPPAATAAPAPIAGSSAGNAGVAPSLGAGAVIGALAAVGVIVGAAVDWSSGYSSNSFDVPLFPLFDSSNFDADPKLGYVLVALAVVGLVGCFIRRAGWVRFLAGALALIPVIAYVVRVVDSYGGTSIDVTDVLGAGPYVAGISAIVLAISPLIDVVVASSRSQPSGPSNVRGVTM